MPPGVPLRKEMPVARSFTHGQKQQEPPGVNCP
jgi:hypothetical protein